MENLKRAAAERAVEEYVESGMTVGLGTGSTAAFAVRRIGALISGGSLTDVRCVPTSERTASLAKEVGVPLVPLSEARPSLTIDGADEIAPDLTLIKGRGGALLREKIVAYASTNGLIVVADGSKRVSSLGMGPLPVEVEPFGWRATLDAVASLGCKPELRAGEVGRPYVTDGGHYVADCFFPSIPNPAALEGEIKCVPGVLECGLFISLARIAVVGSQDRTDVIRPG